VIRAATVTDTAGNAIDTSEFFGKGSEDAEAEPVGEDSDEAGDSDEAAAGE